MAWCSCCLSEIKRLLASGDQTDATARLSGSLQAKCFAVFLVRSLEDSSVSGRLQRVFELGSSRHQEKKRISNFVTRSTDDKLRYIELPNAVEWRDAKNSIAILVRGDPYHPARNFTQTRVKPVGRGSRDRW